MMTKIYKCDLCRDVKQPAELRGLRFSTNTKFKIDTAYSTDGTHICITCLDQLRDQIETACRGDAA